ncbi:IS30 family transposase [Enterococcus sp. AZ048]|uniref:IS30 family transposase n=1 Tax=Enterococcus sp. AZ048 TaxID=2774658 RepID=UPI003F6921A9
MILTPLHGDAVKSITCDHGTEFANSLFINQIENTYQSKIYFAHAYTPQERGTNENTNGLIRAFLPKKLTFESKTQADMIFIANELNTRPKKIHGFSTCKEIYERECAALNNSP